MDIFSPMATGNGAFVVHQILASEISGYRLCGYNPYWSLLPPALSFVAGGGKTDIVHASPDYACFAKRKNIPLVITFHNLVLDQFMMAYSSFAQRIHYKTDLRYFTKKALELASVVTSVSEFTADLVRDELGYSGEIRVIYNGVDEVQFSPIKKINSKKIKVLFSGNLTRRKGADMLPLIAKQLDPGIEIFYTKGLRTKNSLPYLSNLVNIGAIPFSEMPQVYQDADILLFPTLREGFGLAAAEAMACGLPVVATECSSLPELIVDGEGGYLCELGNVNEFAGKINELAASPGLRREMGQFNRERVEAKFTLQRMVDDYCNVFDQVLS